MALTKERKTQILEKYVAMLENARGMVVTEYRGMTVNQLAALRARLRENNASLVVTKNTLLKIALEQSGMAVPDELLNGPVAIAIAYQDLPQTVKNVLEFADDSDVFVIKGGIIGESVVDSPQLKTISELPPLETLRAEILGMMTMPMTQFLGLLDEPARGVVAVIKAGSEGLVNVLAAYSQKDAA
ncbi:MAG: 50S ribosomal protein L10 [Chloroflexi bacterium]|nr:50S ribosomal protein L10 [Chloroflexota bacterium]